MRIYVLLALTSAATSCGDQWIGPLPEGGASVARLARGSTSEPAVRMELTADSYVFTTNRRVARGKIAGGAIETIDANTDDVGDILPTSLAADDHAVYYAKRKSGTVSLGVAKDGQRPDLRPLMPEAGALAFASDGEQLFIGRESGEIYRMGTFGMEFVAAGSPGPFQLATDEQHLIWVAEAGGTSAIFQVPRPTGTTSGTEPTKLASSSTVVGGLVLDEDTCVFYTDSQLGTVNMVWKEGGSIDVMAEGRARPTWVAHDKDRGEIVWIEAANHELYAMSTARTPVGYEKPHRLASGLGNVVSLRVKAEKIYWAQEDGIFALTPPPVK